jgi:hypothetical protein
MAFFFPVILCAGGLLPWYSGHEQETKRFMKTTGSTEMLDFQPPGFFSRWQTPLVAQFWQHSFSADLWPMNDIFKYIESWSWPTMSLTFMTGDRLRGKGVAPKLWGLLEPYSWPFSWYAFWTSLFYILRSTSVNQDSLTSSFPFCIILYVLPILLLWLEIPRLFWIRMKRVDTLVSFLILEEMVLVFPHLVWRWLKACLCSFTMLRYIPSVPSLIRAFKDVNFVKGFFLHALRWSCGCYLCFC